MISTRAATSSHGSGFFVRCRVGVGRVSHLMHRGIRLFRGRWARMHLLESVLLADGGEEERVRQIAAPVPEDVVVSETRRVELKVGASDLACCPCLYHFAHIAGTPYLHGGERTRHDSEGGLRCRRPKDEEKEGHSVERSQILGLSRGLAKPPGRNCAIRTGERRSRPNSRPLSRPSRPPNPTLFALVTVDPGQQADQNLRP